jgi:hypothetical protein
MQKYLGMGTIDYSTTTSLKLHLIENPLDACMPSYFLQSHSHTYTYTPASPSTKKPEQRSSGMLPRCREVHPDLMCIKSCGRVRCLLSSDSHADGYPVCGDRWRLLGSWGAAAKEHQLQRLHGIDLLGCPWGP